MTKPCVNLEHLRICTKKIVLKFLFLRNQGANGVFVARALHSKNYFSFRKRFPEIFPLHAFIVHNQWYWYCLNNLSCKNCLMPVVDLTKDDVATDKLVYNISPAKTDSFKLVDNF